MLNRLSFRIKISKTNTQYLHNCKIKKSISINKNPERISTWEKLRKSSEREKTLLRKGFREAKIWNKPKHLSAVETMELWRLWTMRETFIVRREWRFLLFLLDLLCDLKRVVVGEKWRNGGGGWGEKRGSAIKQLEINFFLLLLFSISIHL